MWSNKPDVHPATNLDAAGKTISNPQAADRTYDREDYILDYSIFCGYYCIDKDVVTIK